MRFGVFFHNLQQDLKSFAYLNAILMLFRILFLVVFSSQLAGSTSSDILEALWYGFRISLKTAGLLAFIGAILSTAPALAVRRWPTELIRKGWHYIAITVLTLGFFARIPYYKIFNSGYNLMLFNGVQDDWHAIYITAVNQYQMWPRLAGVVVVTLLLILGLNKILSVQTMPFQKNKRLMSPATILLLPLFLLLVRFGGGYNYATSVNWENAARASSNLLNEAILDDGQAVYRAYSIYERLQKATNVNISPEELKAAIVTLGGNPNAKNLEDAFIRRAHGKYLDKQPNNIVVVFGENYALWPFLPRYKDLGLVSYGDKFLNSGRAANVASFLANGGGTMPSLEGMITGLAEGGLYANYQEETYKSVYATGLGQTMKKLGYKTCLWYGGFGAWQDIKKFALAQSFDEFHCADEFQTTGGNAWGVPDKELFAEITKYIEKNGNEKTLHFVLTTSNHPPFTMDVDSIGFQRKAVVDKLPESISRDKETIDQLGHIWYADQMMGKFIERTEKIFPDTIFVITGDHAERFSFANEETSQANSAVPCIFYGNAVKSDWFNSKKAGSHMQIIPTLVEMIAPAGYQYVSILPSLYEDEPPFSFNDRIWEYDGKLGTFQNLAQSELTNEQKAQLENTSKSARLISAWRVKKGNSFY